MLTADKWLVVYSRHKKFEVLEFTSEINAQVFVRTLIDEGYGFFVACLRLTSHTKIVADGLAEFCKQGGTSHG